MKSKDIYFNLLLFLGSYKFNFCYKPFSKIDAPPHFRVTQAYPIAAKKAPRLALASLT
jgi:hypothetical protein